MLLILVHILLTFTGGFPESATGPLKMRPVRKPGFPLSFIGRALSPLSAALVAPSLPLKKAPREGEPGLQNMHVLRRRCRQPALTRDFGRGERRESLGRPDPVGQVSCLPVRAACRPRATAQLLIILDLTNTISIEIVSITSQRTGMQNKMKTSGLASLTAGLLVFEVALLLAGCATHDARTHLESVAKDWCETIRASQVMPVYPVTQDVAIGDVFLVQTPIANQARDYERRGFLALDNFRVRLPYTNFHKIYFDGYWKDDFGNTPHTMPEFTNVVTGSNATTGSWTSVAAPR